MGEIRKAIIRLLGVRTIITLSLTVALIYGFVVGKVGTKDFLVYVALAYAHFFSKEKGVQEQEERKEINQYKGGLG